METNDKSGSFLKTANELVEWLHDTMVSEGIQAVRERIVELDGIYGKIAKVRHFVGTAIVGRDRAECVVLTTAEVLAGLELGRNTAFANRKATNGEIRDEFGLYLVDIPRIAAIAISEDVLRAGIKRASERKVYIING